LFNWTLFSQHYQNHSTNRYSLLLQKGRHASTESWMPRGPFPPVTIHSLTKLAWLTSQTVSNYSNWSKQLTTLVQMTWSLRVTSQLTRCRILQASHLFILTKDHPVLDCSTTTSSWAKISNLTGVKPMWSKFNPTLSVHLVRSSLSQLTTHFATGTRLT
jgi:hypothetical protein